LDGKVLAPRIIYKPGFTLVGLACEEVPPGDRKDALWEALGECFNEIPHADPDAGFGVHILSGSDRQYLAGLAVRRAGVVPPGMAALTLPANAYAVFMHRGLSESLQETVKEIFNGWQPESDYEQAGAYFFEYYDDRFQPNSRDSVIFLWLPVKQR